MSDYVYALYELYGKSTFTTSRTGEKKAMEDEAFVDALKALDPEDRVFIEEQVERLSGEAVKISQFGNKSAREVLAKVGIFLFANGKKMRTP